MLPNSPITYRPLQIGSGRTITRLDLAVRLLLIAAPFLPLAGFLAVNAVVGSALLFVVVTIAFLLDQKARRMKHDQILRFASTRARLKAVNDRERKVNLSADFARAQNGFSF